MSATLAALHPALGVSAPEFRALARSARALALSWLLRWARSPLAAGCVPCATRTRSIKKNYKSRPWLTTPSGRARYSWYSG